MIVLNLIRDEVVEGLLSVVQLLKSLDLVNEKVPVTAYQSVFR